MERYQDQPAGLREVDRLREGIQVQRQPGTLLALGLCRWPVQVKTAAKPNPGLEPAAAGSGSGRYPGPAPAGFALGWMRVSHAKRPRVSKIQRRPGTLLALGRCRWPFTRWKPSPWSGARINRPGSGRLTSAAQAFGKVFRFCLKPFGVLSQTIWRWTWPVQAEALPVERDQDQPGG